MRNPSARPSRPRTSVRFAALDLGTNNCRLLIAARSQTGFRVVGGYSQIVRLGEGLSAAGTLQPAAMDRAVAALGACAQKVRSSEPVVFEGVATQACRGAANGMDFLARVRAETGLCLRVIDAEEEARLAAFGCLELVDRTAEFAMVVDVGGGSTELCLIEAHTAQAGCEPNLVFWASVPVGVVGLAEAEQEPADQTSKRRWFDALTAIVARELEGVVLPPAAETAFQTGRGQLIGASGAVTSVAGVHLGLSRYQRARVDGQWLSRGDCAAAAHRLRDMGADERAGHPCIGPDRADLVLPGCAIMEAVLQRWPVSRVRVADRGLREGILWRLVNAHPGGARR